jgi:hypothetical protein
MMRSNNNGAWLALGMVGLAAGAAAISTRRMGTLRGGSFARLPHGSKCVCCGTKVGSFAKVEQDQEDKPSEQRGSSLIRARFDSKSAFLVPFEDTLVFKREYDAFKSKTIASFNRMSNEEQRVALQELGRNLFRVHGIGRYDEDGNLVEPIDAYEYASDKAHLSVKKNAPNRQQALKASEADYLRAIYVDRLWTLSLLSRYGAERPENRRAVFAHAEADSIFYGLDLFMSLPKPVPASAFATSPGPLPIRYSEDSEAMQSAQEKQEQALNEDVGSDDKPVKGPELKMFRKGQRVSIFFIAQAGSQYFPYGLSRIPLLTATTKMSSPSFGLPAGLKTDGGTCPARMVAQRAFRSTKVGEGGSTVAHREVICDRCYAMGANYGYANNMIAQEGRSVWIRQIIKPNAGSPYDPSQLPGLLASMVASYALHGGGGGRSQQEIGRWNGSSLEYSSGKIKAPKAVEQTSLRLELDRPVLRKEQYTRAGLGLTNFTKISTTSEWFKAMKTPKDAVAGFFRIHDSGDFGIGIQYMDAWAKTFRMLPYVQFWAPTRMWAMVMDAKIIEASPERKRFRDLFMQEFVPGKKHSSGLPMIKTFRLRKAGSSNLSTDIKKQQPQPVPVNASPGEAGTQDASLDKALNRQVTFNKANISDSPTQGLRFAASPPNIAMRPSGLYVTRPELAPGVKLAKSAKPTEDEVISTGSSSNIPYIEGLSAGSGVVAALKGVYPKVYDMRGIQAYACPVYTKDESGKEAKSCREAKCRACWLAQNLPVFYGAH